MIEKITGVVLLVFILLFLVFYTIYTEEKIDAIILSCEKINTKDEAERLYEDFKSQKMMISLTVNELNILEIENRFTELIGYLKEGDKSNVLVTKNRLKLSLESLRQSCGVNIQNII